MEFTPTKKNAKKRPGIFCSLNCYWESLKGRKLTIAHKDKISKKMKGIEQPKMEKSPQWITDRSKLKKSANRREDSESKHWTRQVKNRDLWKCRIADDNCDGKLEAHHILRWSLFPELRYSLNNGITLCHHHHPRKLGDEVILSPYFKELITQTI